jgi:hypothetical protein
MEISKLEFSKELSFTHFLQEYREQTAHGESGKHRLPVFHFPPQVVPGKKTFLKQRPM